MNFIFITSKLNLYIIVENEKFKVNFMFIYFNIIIM